MQAVVLAAPAELIGIARIDRYEAGGTWRFAVDLHDGRVVDVDSWTLMSLARFRVAVIEQTGAPFVAEIPMRPKFWVHVVERRLGGRL